MPRTARIVMPGVPHHITQRGNNQQDVFFTDDDRRLYLELLKKHAEQSGLEIVAYCLMANHVHLVVIPDSEGSLAKALGAAHFRYTQHINRLHARSGHLWQNRFYSCARDAKQLWVALRYVERNPVRARIVQDAWEYPWSSAAAHVGRGDPSKLLDLARWARAARAQDWQQDLRSTENEEDLFALRSSTHTGRPLGTDKFVSKMEALLGRRLRAGPVGRPKGRKASAKPR